MAEAKKYYWLKLQKDFFKRHDIRIIESMPNGKDYILFYMKLLVESIGHEGSLRFSDTIPYNDEMLATITNTNIDVVRSAIKIFTQLELMTMLDDGTIFLSEIQAMIGCETDWASKKRDYRIKLEDNQKAIEGQKRTLSDKSKSLELEKELDKEKDIKSGRFTPPSLEEVSIYCKGKNSSVDASRFCDYYESIGWMRGKTKMKDWKATVRTWESKDKADKPIPKQIIPIEIQPTIYKEVTRS